MVACDWDAGLGKGENRKFQHAINLKTGTFLIPWKKPLNLI